MDFLHTVEFYVIATLFAAMIVAFLARPSSRSEARQYFLAGDLSNESNRSWCDEKNVQPSISMYVRDDGALVLTRHGLEGVSTSGAVSLAVTIVGFDITIEERIVQGNSLDEPIDAATFVLDFLAPERYYLKYNSSASSTFASATLILRPDYKKHLPLSL